MAIQTINPYQNNTYYYNKTATNPSFQSTESKQIDVPKQGMTTTAKWAIGAGLTALAATGIYLATKGKVSKGITKELKAEIAEKLKVTPLAEHIEFKEAKSLEEAIKYSKETLKIKDVDPEFNLDALNWVNKGLTDVSNFHKGKAKMPNGLRFRAEEDYLRNNIMGHDKPSIAVAAIKHNKQNCNDFGYLYIEKRLFDNDFLNKKINENLYSENMKKCYGIKNGKIDTTNVYIKGNPLTLDDKLAQLAEKFYDNPESLTIGDKFKLYYHTLNPAEKTKFNHPNYKYKYICKLEDTCQTIHHELGHLQDMRKNYVSKLDNIEDFAAHWNRRDELEKDFIEKTPILKEFFSKETQETVGKVSEYSQCGICEFIAETYAGLVSGKQYPDDVMKLFNKYSGGII